MAYSHSRGLLYTTPTDSDHSDTTPAQPADD
ncbi:hypothetical protein HASA104033_07775 [Halobacterium salinarum]|uniref:Uncharacterized protein n=1 Tax=Halobacterium salinarum (strain ATCC 33171 / DSM 3754 / JCM 8978 / NBRC 102687 / NCIMB 764 / 91-R6) TaxID=2597657 RepID=A0A4D6GQF2_HALS9|nr:uncharacterized protein HBSAL_00865 [Halobacterium salinarum]